MKFDVSAPQGNASFEAVIGARNVRWYKGHYLKLNAMLLLLIMTSMNNGYDGSMMNGLQTVVNWQEYFGYPTGSLLGVFNAIQSIGGIAGLPFAPWMNDKYGRRWALFFGNALIIIGTAIQTGAQNVGMFIGCRFLIGFGLAFACMASPVLITELAFPTHRAPITGLYNTTWYLGSIMAAWITYGTFRLENTWSWRIPSVLQGVPSIIQIILVFWLIPESPRWLVSHGRVEEARAILLRLHCNNDETDPLIDFEMHEITEGIRFDQEVEKKTTYKSLFSTPGNRRRMMAIIPFSFFSQWSGNGIISYYLNLALRGVGITSPEQQNLINGMLQLWNIVTAYSGALSVDRLGRRTLWLTSAAGMTVTYAIITACSAVYANSPESDPNTAAGRAVVAFFFIYYLFYNLAMSPLLCAYTLEILPYNLRTKGLFVSSMSVNCSLVFNQYVNPIALPALGWKYYVVYTCWLAFETVWLYFTIIETKGPNGPLPLEEISRIFDGKDAVSAIRTVEDGNGDGFGNGQDSFGADKKQDLEVAHEEERDASRPVAHLTH